MSANSNAATGPTLTNNTIENLGLTLLATGGPNPALDVFFIHGLQGHPEDTWTLKSPVEAEDKQWKVKNSKLKFWKRAGEHKSAERDTMPVQDRDIVYWPTRLLAHDLPDARIFTYGYDSQVTHFFNGPANQSTVTDNGRALLSSIASQRYNCQRRPLMLIVHSLGGIVVKSALRIAARADDIDADLRDIYHSTFAILFFGTPHRGSEWTDVGQIARIFASVLGFSTAQYNLQALQSNAEILQILRDEFAQMLGKEAFHITSFQESYGYKGLKGFDAKIVEPDSSGIDHIFERKVPVNSNHMDICKFAVKGSKRREYDEKVRSEIFRHWLRVSNQRKEQSTKLGRDTNDVDFLCKELLQSMEFSEARNRYDQVEEACSQTFDWLFMKPELGFRAWLETGKGLYFIRGQPASGKSTLMKWAFNDFRTTAALGVRSGRQAQVNFFFHDRGSEIQSSFKGLLQSIIHQILNESRELLQSILPIHQEMVRRSLPFWTEQYLTKALQSILRQRIVSLDITLFLDALDEYDGNFESIANFLSSIATTEDTSLTRLRVCFSSRPLQILLDKFGGLPGFDIREHTADDVKQVIESKMSQNARMSRFMQAETPEDRLLTLDFKGKVFSRAKGVFLWVILVLDELLEEFTEGESMQGLIRQLDRLPTKLEDFYQHTWDRLPRKYLGESSLIFETLRCATTIIDLHDLFEICRCAHIPSLTECTPCAAAEGGAYDHDGEERWLRSRTAGLVQLVPIVPLYRDLWEASSESSWMSGGRAFCPMPERQKVPSHQVQFLHQTVKSFSTNANLKDRLAGFYPSWSNGHAYIARYSWTLFYQHPQIDSGNSNDQNDAIREQGYFWERKQASHLLRYLAQHTSMAEAEVPQILFPLLTEFGDDRIAKLFSSSWWLQDMDWPLLNMCAFVVVFELCDLLHALLEAKEGQGLASSPPLLHLAVIQSPPRTNMSGEKRSRILRTLLSHGANASEIFEEQTAYEKLCELIMNDQLRVDDLRKDVRAMVVPFLEARQDPNMKVGYNKRSGRRGYRRSQQRLLHYAASSANSALITALLEYGAALNTTDEDGLTPLDCVCDAERALNNGFQLVDMVEAFLKDDAWEELPFDDYLKAASLLLSRGAQYGTPIEDTVDKLGFERKSITKKHIDGLRSRGINVDVRLIRCPENQIKTGWSRHIFEPLGFMKWHLPG